MIALKASFPSEVCTIRKNTLWWRGKIQPTPLSPKYTVLLTYNLCCSPKVWVLGDELQKLDSPDFPHHYSIDVDKKKVNICLYRYSEFSKNKLLTKTIIPWTVEWLYFYEIWLATGEWCGGGEHPHIQKFKECKKAY
jgi:hypothetical protein